MKRKISLIGIFFFSSLLVGNVWAEPNMNPGKWEITTQTETVGMGGGTQTITHVQCITQDEILPMSQDASQQCQMTDIEIDGDTVRWKIVCAGQGGSMEGIGEITYSGDAMEGMMEMTITGANMQIINHLNGRRIGECEDQTGVSSSTAKPVPSNESRAPSKVEKTVSNDAQDAGKAAHGKAKQETVNEIKKGVRGLFKGLFK